MHARSLSLLVAIFLLLPAFVSRPAAAQDKLRGRDLSGLYRPNIRKAVNRGLGWLAEQQNEDGSWTSIIGYKLNNQVVGGKPYPNVGVTAVAGLAFLSAGSFPGRGTYGDVVEGAVQFILSHSDPQTGYISHRDTRMYEHGFATLFLAEVYGMTGDRDVRQALKGAVRIIRSAQNRDGGWRYQPRPKDADVSVTVTILQSLRAANNVGITVPESVINKAMEYVKSCYRSDGAFMYQAGRMSRTSWALTAAGVVSLQSAGKYDSPKVEKGVEWLWRALRRENRMAWGNYHYFYGHYYASQALYQSGWRNFKSYYNMLADQVVPNQKPDGHWEDDVSATYATSMACLVLQMPVRYLPIFQKGSRVPLFIPGRGVSPPTNM